MNRDRLGWWIQLLVEQAEALERPWLGDLARELGDHLGELREMDKVGVRCAVCGEVLDQPATGRRRKYCPRPRTCRDRAARAA